jgi:large subunit ribosomal protein L13
MKTYSQKSTEVKRTWHLIDAAALPFGRVATTAATLLIGKGKPTVTPHTDGGDFVVIVNAGKMYVSGAKQTDKAYYSYSGYPGGLKTRKMSDLGNVAALEHAIRGMLPRNKLQPGRLARLKVYEGAEHNHSAQQPKQVSVKGVK